MKRIGILVISFLAFLGAGWISTALLISDGRSRVSEDLSSAIEDAFGMAGLFCLQNPLSRLGVVKLKLVDFTFVQTVDEPEASLNGRALARTMGPKHHYDTTFRTYGLLLLPTGYIRVDAPETVDCKPSRLTRLGDAR